MEYTGKYVLQKVVKTLTACTIFCAYTTTTNLFATEIMAGKADTFISQAMPKGEFSKSEFLAISRDGRCLLYKLSPERHLTTHRSGWL